VAEIRKGVPLVGVVSSNDLGTPFAVIHCVLLYGCVELEIEVLLVLFRLTHNVVAIAKRRKLGVKLGVAALENVALREKEPWISVEVEVAI
jgi:hypothetical protein